MFEPGMKAQRIALFLTAGIAGVLFLYGLGDIPLISQNEARRAVPAFNMLVSGNWLVPISNGEMYLSKPPLLYWLAALSSLSFGVINEWTVRLPSALAAAAIVLVCYKYALWRFGPWAALFTVQILIANVSFAMFARRAEIEMLLTALCVGSALSLLQFIYGDGKRKWLLSGYFLLGLAVLTKGPLALLFVTLPLLICALVQRGDRQWDFIKDVRGWAVFILVGASWYAAVSWQHGIGVWSGIVQKDMLGKMYVADAAPVYNYLFWVFTDFFPASLVLLVAPIATWRRWRECRETVALAIAVLAPLVLFSLFKDKHAKYLLPIYPFVAMLVGKRVGEIFEASTGATRRLILAAGIAMPLGYAAFYAGLESKVFSDRISVFLPFSSWLDSAKPFPLYAYRGIDERIVFYAHRQIPVMGDSELLAARAARRPFFLLVENPKTDNLKDESDCVVKSFTPYLKKNRSLVIYGFGNACAQVASMENRNSP